MKIDVTSGGPPTTLTVKISEIDGDYAKIGEMDCDDDEFSEHVCTLVRRELQHLRQETFMADVMQGLDLTLAQLQTHDRRSHVTAARQELMVRLHELGWTHARIGVFLCRDRTTAIHGVRQGYARRQGDR